MRCDETAEFVSALCDGEAIPRDAAEHVSSCVDCQKRLREYMAMGAELRLMASLTVDESVAPRVWNEPRNRFASWWQKGWETMRIPRFAFVLLIAAIVALGSTFAVVQVRAHSNGSVLLLKFAWPGGTSASCPISTQDKNQGCAFLGQMNGKSIGYEINLIGREGEGVELAVRTKTFGSLYGTKLIGDIRKEPEKQVLFEPGQTMTLDFPGAGALTVTGEWMDHMPVFLGSSTEDAQAGPDELRLIWPVLISDKQVLGDFQGGSAISDKAGEGVAVSLPGQGRFLFAFSPMRGGVQGRVTGNRISFEDGGRSYVFVTGAPICRAEHLWVLHQASSKQDDVEHGAIGSVSAGELRQLAPEVVVGGDAKN
jgi:hypothetical protein